MTKIIHFPFQLRVKDLLSNHPNNHHRQQPRHQPQGRPQCQVEAHLSLLVVNVFFFYANIGCLQIRNQWRGRYCQCDIYSLLMNGDAY